MSIKKYLALILIPTFLIGMMAWNKNSNPSHDTHTHIDQFMSQDFASKSGAVIAVNLEPVDHAAAKRGEVFELKAYTASRIDAETLKIRWVLPRGFELVEGSLESKAHDVIRGSRYEHSIKLRRNGDEDDLAVFEVRVGDTNVGATRTYSTARHVESESASIVSAFKYLTENKKNKSKRKKADKFIH